MPPNPSPAWLRRAHDFFLAPQPQHALVGARILLGSAIFGTYTARLPEWRWMYGPDGVAGFGFYQRFPDAAPFNQRVAEILHVLAKLPSEAAILGLYLLLLVSALAFAAGAWSRLSGVATLVLHILFYARNSFVYEGSWAEFVNAPLLYVICSGAGRHLSVDALLARRRGAPAAAWLGPGWPLRLMQIHVTCMYVAAGWSRLDKETWLLGELVFVALSGATHSKLVIDWRPFLPILKLGTWAALALEVTAPVMLWVRPLRRLWALGLVGLHLVLELLTNVGWWQAVMIAGLLSFLLPWRRDARSGP
jgi:hypothetical protein